MGGVNVNLTKTWITEPGLSLAHSPFPFSKSIDTEKGVHSEGIQCGYGVEVVQLQ